MSVKYGVIQLFCFSKRLYYYVHGRLTMSKLTFYQINNVKINILPSLQSQI